jgi:hypothetical protein
MLQNFIHYIASSLPLGEDVSREWQSYGGERVCRSVSAGHNKHEYTTGYAYELIVK